MSDDDIPTVDEDEIDPDKMGVPTRRVRIEGSVSTLQNSQNTSQNVSNISEVEVPDMSSMGDYLNNCHWDIDLGSISDSFRKRRKRAVEAKSWEAIREIASEMGSRRMDASDENRFVDVLYRASATLEKQGGNPEEAEIFVSPKTNREVHRWMDRHNYASNVSCDLSNPSKTVRVGGFSYQFFETEHLKTGELVLADTEIHAAPHSKPFVLVQNLPIGVEIQVEVDGRSNEVVVNK